MKHEFTKITQGDETHYVLENASAGGTSAGSVASVSMPLGGVRRRAKDNILAQEGDKVTIPVSQKPRQGVPKTQTGAGAHRDKKKEQKQGKSKHKKPYMEDHEIQMASSELQAIAKNAVRLLDLVRRYSEAEGLEAWQQSKITKAADYLNSVLQSISGEQSGLSENDLAQQMMALAKSKGMNPRLAGTPEQERERTQQMMAQRAKDRENQPAPAGPSTEERAELEARLKDLKAKLDPNYEYSDDHRVWARNKEIEQSIASIQRRLAQGVAEYGDTAKGQKMLTKVQKRAVDRTIRADDKNKLEPDYTKRDLTTVRKNQATADRAWGRMSDLDLDEASVYKKDQDLSSVSTQELEAFVRKHWFGGVPTYGQGESVKRAMRELRRRQKQGVAEGFLGDREYNRVMPFVKRIASEVSDYDRDEFGEELWSLLDQKYGSKFAQSVLDDLDFYWDTYTELTGQQGVAEGLGLYGPFTVTINTGERPKSRTKTKKFRREDDAILWAQDWLEDAPQYVFATAEVTDPDGNVVWTTDEQGVAEGFGSNYAEQLAQQVFDHNPDIKDEEQVLNLGYNIAKSDLGSRAQGIFRDEDFPSDFVSAYFYLQKQGVAEVAPKGWEKTVKAMKKHDEIDNPWALAHWMKSKGYKSHKEDAYMQELADKLGEKLDPNADPDVWIQDFQKADPNRYHQFRNKTPEKKAQMAIAARYAAKQPKGK